MIMIRLAFATALFCTAPALAQHAHDGAGPNGGRVRESGSYHLELVAKGQRIDVYLSDAEEKAVPAAGHAGSAIFVIDGKPARIALAPAEGNRLTGQSEAPIAKGAKGAVRLTKPDGTTASVSFH